MKEKEINFFNIFATARIGKGIGVIALILFGWLALRYANAVCESGDATIIHKVLVSVFALAGGLPDTIGALSLKIGMLARPMH